MSNNDNQSAHRTGRLSSRKKDSAGSTNHNSEIKPKRDSDEVLGAIEGVEKQLDSLRRAHEEHRVLTEELNKRRDEIEETAEEIESRETELSAREVELAEMRQEVEERESEIAQRTSGLEQRESQLAQHAESIEGLEAVVEAKSKQIDQRVEELDKQLQGISHRKDELAKLEQQARERIELDNNLQEQITQLTEDLDQTRARLGGREIELKERSKVVEELSVQASRLEKQMAEITSKAAADEETSLKMVDEMQVQLQEAQTKLDAHDEAMLASMSRIEELERISQSRTQELQEATKTIEKLSSIESTHAQTIDQVSQLESKLKDAHSKLSATQSELQESQQRFKAAKQELETAPSGDQLSVIQTKLDKSTQELKLAKTRAAELESQLQDFGSSATEEVEASKAHIAKLTEQLKEAQTSLQKAAESRKQIQSDLQAKLDEAIQSGQKLADSSSSNTQQVQELTSKLAQRDEQVTAIRAKYDELSDQLLQEQAKSEEQQSQIERFAEMLDVSNDREEKLNAQIEELNELISSAQESTGSMSDEWVTTRRERLDRVKMILRVNSDKVRRATEALRDRYDQCEKVLLKRSELVEAYQAVADAQKKLAKREARSGTLLGLSGLGLLLMMIAGLSWFVAGQVTPGTYASRVTVAARAGERVMTTDDLASWQGYIEGLVSDPQFIEQAAQRMKRRGIESLAIPGTLGAHMSESLDVIAAEPGKVELEYRGHGAANTQRVLDTYALTLTAQANASRARRLDGALTSITDPATIGDAPLDTTRVETAGMIFGGSSAATLLFGGIFWRRLAKLKANFERDSRVEPLFDEDSWEVEGKEG